MCTLPVPIISTNLRESKRFQRTLTKSLAEQDVPEATSCHVSADGFELWNGTTAVVNTAIYGANTIDVTYTLECDMPSGTTQTGRVTVRVPVQAKRSDYSFNNMRGANIMDESNTSAIAWFSNSQNLAPIAKAKLGLNYFRMNMDLSQAVDEGTFGVGGEGDFLQTLSDSLDTLAKENIKAILVFGIEPSVQYRKNTMCRCPSNVSFGCLLRSGEYISNPELIYFLPLPPII
jgi:hypothetical protein